LFYEVIIHQPCKFDNIPPVQVPEALPIILTPDEVYAMIDSKKDNRKHQTILQLIYSGGLRISEPIRTLQSHIWQDKDFISGNMITKYHITNAKGAKDRVIVIPNETNAMIEAYKQEYHPVNYLFNGWKQEPQYTQESIGAVFKQAKQRCGITKDVTPHSLRHSRATHLLDAGLSLPYLKEFLGHKRVETTMIYLHCSVHGMARMINQADVLIDASVKAPMSLLYSNTPLQLPVK
jgi:site-specific recombinase XerD